ASGAAGGVAGAGAAGGAASAGGTGTVGGPAGVGAAGGAGTASPGGARIGGTGAAGAGGAAGVGAVAAGAVPTRGAAGGGAVGGLGAGGAVGVVAGDSGAEGIGAVSAVSGGAARPRPYYVPLLKLVLGLPPSTSPPPPRLLSPPLVQSQSQLQPASPLPGPSPYSGPTRGLSERREPESRPASPESPPVSPESSLESPVRAVRTGRRVPRQRPPPVPGTQYMTLRPSTAPQRVPLPSPPASSLPALIDPESDSLHTASPIVTRLLATVVTDPSFESTAASALVVELVDFAAHCRLDYAASLVAKSESVTACPPSVGGECALGTDVLEDRQEDFECFAAAVPHLVSMLLAPEGDPDAPDISTPRSYTEAIEGPYSSQWAKRPPGSPPAFKARYHCLPTGQPARGDLAAPPTKLHWVVSCWYPVEPPAASLWSPPGTPRVARHTEDDLAALGFSPSTSDPSLFLRTDATLPPFYVLVYVDDLVFATADTEALTHVKSFSASASRSPRHNLLLCLPVTRSQLHLRTSPCEAEIYAGAMAAQELRWLTYQPHSPLVLYVDNKAMLALCQEHRVEHRTNHIALRYFLARELQQRGQLRLAYMASQANTADVFTKALQPSDHQRSSAPTTTTDTATATTTATPTATTAAPAYCATMASLRVLAFDHEGRPVQFDMWLDDLQLYLLSDIKDDVSLFDHVSGTVTAPPATADRRLTYSALYDAVVARHSSPSTAALGRLLTPYLFPLLSAFATVEDLVSHLRASDARYRATVPAEFLDRNQPPMFITLYFIVTCLPDSLRSVRDHFLSLDPTSLIVDLLEQHLLAGETSAVAVGAARGTPRPPFFEGCSPSPLAPSYASAAAADVSVAAADVSVAEDVGAASASAKRRSSKGKGGKGGGGGSGISGGGSSGGGGGGGTDGGSGGSGSGGGRSGGIGSSGGGGTGGGGTGARRVGSGGGQRQQHCPYVIRTSDRAGQTCEQLHTHHRCFFRLDDAWRAEFGDDVELPCRADLLRPRIAIFDLDFVAILSAMYALSVSAEGDCYRCVPPDPGIAAAALGASESGTLPGTAPAQALNTFTLDSSALRCFFRDSTTLTPLSTPVLVRLADPCGGPVVARSSTVLPCLAVPSGSLSGLHLPSFFANLVSTAALQDAMVTTTTPGGSSLYTLATEPPQVGASAQVSVSSQVAASCSCRLLSHQTLLGHHHLGHPSLPRLRGMHSRLLVFGFPRSLPPLPPSLAPPCLPCVEGRQRAAPHSLFSPTTAPLQTLHMDVVDVLIPWIRTVHLQLRERFGQDLPVLRLHSDRGGEFSSNLLRDFCRGEGILQSFTLPDSPQQNGIAERRIGLVMEVARTSMIHVAAPNFLWPFAVRYAAHQLNLWLRVSLLETSPTLQWMGEVGDVSVFRVWGSRAFVRDTSADKLSPRAIPYVFLGFVPDEPGWQFYHPTSRCVFLSQDVPIDESVPFYHLFPYRSAPPPPPRLFLAPGPPLVDPLPPQGLAPSGLSRVDPLPGPAPVQVAVCSGASRGAASGGAAYGGEEPGGSESGGVEPGGAESEGAGSGGAEPWGAELGGAEPGGAERVGVETEGAEPWGPASASPRLSPQQLCEWFVQRAHLRSGATGARGAGVPTGASGTRGTTAIGPGV
ncbi:unnamed protein product, partial [Closterium sp. NIES-53]